MTPALPDWNGFFTMAGTSAAALIGLVFVVITLGAQMSRGGVEGAIHAFVTPCLMHFAGVLLQSLLILAPWPSSFYLGIPFAILGLAGVLYAAMTSRRMVKLGIVRPSELDWLAYVGAPTFAGILTASGGVGFLAGWSLSALAIAAGTLVLLFVAIYQAWDVTLWIVRNRKKDFEQH